MIKGKLLQKYPKHCLIVQKKCMKIQPNSFNSVQLTEQTKKCIYLCYKENNLKNKDARVMVLVPRLLNVFYKCMKFCWNTSTGYQVRADTK